MPKEFTPPHEVHNSRIERCYGMRCMWEKFQDYPYVKESHEILQHIRGIVLQALQVQNKRLKPFTKAHYHDA